MNHGELLVRYYGGAQSFGNYLGISWGLKYQQATPRQRAVLHNGFVIGYQGGRQWGVRTKAKTFFFGSRKEKIITDTNL